MDHNPLVCATLFRWLLFDLVFLCLKAPAPLLAPKSNAVEKRKSLQRDDAQAAQVPPVQKVEPFATASPGEVEKLRKEVSELREMMSKMEKKHNEMLKKLEEKFIHEIEILTNDFDEEKKQNAANSSALKVELDRIKRRQSRFNLEETQWFVQIENLISVGWSQAF